MILTQYIKELLYQQECVTIPGFGSFVTQNHPIRVNRFTGEFTPPSRTISFNRLIQENDGLLASYVAKRENIAYNEALVKIEKECTQWNKRLDKDSLILPGIGEFSLNAENKLRFLPHGKINFDASAVGLKAFQKTPLKAQIKAASVVPPISNASSKSSPMQDNKESLAFTPEKKEDDRPPYAKYTVIGVIAVAILGAVYYFGNQYLESERLKSTQLAEKRIAKNVEEASFDLGTIAAISYETEAQVETVEDNSITVESGQFYSVIAGSFRDQANAERKLATLKEQGFEEATFAAQSPDGLIRVAYGRFETKRQAYSLLNFINNSLNEEAWYLVEGY